jgi:hypothetical protein
MLRPTYLYMRHHHSLGAEVRSFGPNIKTSIAVILVGTFVPWLTYMLVVGLNLAFAWIIFFSISVGFGLLILSHLWFRIWVHESGISYRGILGHGEIRWSDLDRIFFGSYSVHAHYVPLGTFYRLRLISRHGQKLSIGERIGDADELASLIQGYTLTQMFQRALREFENGKEVNFGSIRVNRKVGIRYYKWFSWHEIRWKDWTVYGISDSHVNLGGLGKLFQANIAAEKVANVHVLEHLLDGVRKKAIDVGV